MGSIWTDSKVEELKSLSRKGFSNDRIAREMGLTRNQVIGKKHRLFGGRKELLPKSAATPKKIKPDVPRQKKSRRMRRRMTGVKCEQEIISMRPLPMVETRSHHCMWILGEGDMCCGNQVVSGKPYCEDHCCLAYGPAGKWRIPEKSEGS